MVAVMQPFVALCKDLTQINAVYQKHLLYLHRNKDIV